MVDNVALGYLERNQVDLFNKYRLKEDNSKRLETFQDTNLSNKNLPTAAFSFLNFKRAKFINSNLQKCDFRFADLRGAILIRADLTGAQLNGADLSNANLSEAKVTQPQLNSAKGTNYTIIPEHLGYPSHWITRQGDLFEFSPETIDPLLKNFQQIPAPAKFIQKHINIDVETTSEVNAAYSDEYKNGVFLSFREQSKEIPLLLEQCNVDRRTCELARQFAKFTDVELEEYQVILGGNKFKSLQRCIEIDWDAMSEVSRAVFTQWQNNHSILEEMYPEAQMYRRNEQFITLPSDELPDEIEKILSETLESQEFKELLTERAQYVMKDIEAQAVIHDPKTIKERTIAILTSFNNLSKTLEKIIVEAEQGLSRSLQLFEQAQKIYLKAQPIIEWASVFLDKL